VLLACITLVGNQVGTAIGLGATNLAVVNTPSKCCTCYHLPPPPRFYPPCRRPRIPYAGPYSQGAATGEEEHSEPSLDAMQVPTQTAAAWGGDKPDFARKWPECKGRCINGMCALLWDRPRCCYVSRRHHHYDASDDDNEGPAAYPYKNIPEPEEQGHGAIGDGKLMGYWLNKEFYCTE